MSRARPALRGLGPRLTALAMAQLALISAASVLIAWLTRPGPPRDLDLLMEEARAAIEARGDGDIEAIAGEVGLALTIYSADGALVRTSGHAPVPNDRERGMPPPHARSELGPPPELLDLGPPDGGPPHPLLSQLSGGRVLRGRPERPAPALLGPILTFLVAGLVLAGGGLLTARWIVRPLHALQATAHAIAAGDAGARTRSRRRDELGDVARAVDEMADRIETSRRAERELLANVSHELKTPLARLKVALELAGEGHAAGQRALTEAATDIAELDGIVESILLAFRLERSDKTLEFGLPATSLRTVEIRELVDRAAERFRSAHRDRTLELTRQADAKILGDGVLLGRALQNLLDNADKYSAKDLPVIVEVRRVDRSIEIAVSDQGIGIDASDLPRIFEPFFRTDRSRTRSRGGVGLGLTLSRRIVEAHGGTLVVTSPARGVPEREGAGPGTTLTLTLPSADTTDTNGHTGATVGAP